VRNRKRNSLWLLPPNMHCFNAPISAAHNHCFEMYNHWMSISPFHARRSVLDHHHRHMPRRAVREFARLLCVPGRPGRPGHRLLLSVVPGREHLPDRQLLPGRLVGGDAVRAGLRVPHRRHGHGRCLVHGRVLLSVRVELDDSGACRVVSHVCDGG
jgi:hypothetical protein